MFHNSTELRDNMWSRRLMYRVVKHESCETYWILLGWLMTTNVSFEVTVSSTFDSHKLSSWKVVHQCEHVNTHRWMTFQLLSLWLFVDGTVTSNDTCVVSRLPQSMLNTSADHLNDQLTITVFFLSHRIFVYLYHKLQSSSTNWYVFLT